MSIIVSRESFLQGEFKRYYLMHTLPEIRAVSKREWAIIPFGGKMHRHLSIQNHTSLMSLLRQTVPAHVYHSAAMYARPAAPTMDKKDRIGTDLVFDLDADHVPGANLWTYEVQLQKIKQQTIKLIAALEVDLGIPLQNMEVVFSGRRGYHIRVTNKAHLSNAARREIAAAFTGAGLNLSGELLKVDTGGEVLLQLPPDGGWAARARRNLEGFLEHLKTLPEAERSKAIKTIPGIGAKGAQHINPEMYSPGGIWTSSAGEQQAWKKLWAYAWDSARIDIDAPVTADIHRIVRCPDSLHGQTGLRAALLPPGALEYFHPLTDAVVFDDHPVTVIPSQDMKFSLRGETFSLHSGDEVDLPKYAAVFAFAGS